MTISHDSPPRHGAFARWLRGLLAHPLARDLNLDSTDATVVHTRLIREKPFLRKLYEYYYTHYDAAIRASAPGGLILEVGAGGSFFRETTRTRVRTIDLRPGADVSVVGSALQMPFVDQSVSTVLMQNVLHHLPGPELFFSECIRVLRPGGRVCMIEPFVSPLSRRLVRPLHHEPWDELAGWSLPSTGPMTGANMAMPWIIFCRDRSRYDALFPRLPVETISRHTIAMYVLSGGVSMRSMLPGSLFGMVRLAESALAPAGSQLASAMTITLRRA